MKKIIIILTILMTLTGCSNPTKTIDKPETTPWETTPNRYPGIHDPSIFVDEQNGEKIYYIFGTHISQAKSTDLSHWEIPKRANGYVNMDENIIFGNTYENLAETFKWAGHDDADSSGGFNLWAPDVFYNEKFDWGDGTFGAYMYYYSASSTWRRSAIGFMVSEDVEGPYTYVDTIVYSGFTKEDSTDGSDRNTNYVNTHLDTLIKNGVIDGFNDKWSRKVGKEYNTDYAPNALDPAFIYDENDNLWMVYGSWSGGIYLLQIDEKTGIPMYPGTDGETEDGRHIDRYFGIKLAGGYHQSNEGPYIIYSPESDFYYLFVTYGGLAADGGYNMRLFRSKDITGPYVDAKGHRPLFTQADRNDAYGIKIMGNYSFDGMTHGYKSPGHNSALVEDDHMYLVFHTRFNNRGEQFELKVHEMVMNDAGWPVVLPYPYHVDFKRTTDILPIEMVAGTYEMINHTTQTFGHMGENQTLILNEDGTIEGDVLGTWSLDGYYITFDITGDIYHGVISDQQINLTRTKRVLSLIGDNNEAIYANRELEE